VHGSRKQQATSAVHIPGPGGLIWVQVQSLSGPVYIANIYTPNHCDEQINTWIEFYNELPRGQWILASNFYMIEQQMDDTSCFSLMNHMEK
jgi:hypothetical protein